MKKPSIKISIQILLVVVYVSLSFAQVPITITIFKPDPEADLAGFNLFQGENIEPFASVDAATITPEGTWIWKGDITIMNGKTMISVTAFDTSGNESDHSPGALFDPPPGAPTISVTVAAE